MNHQQWSLRVGAGAILCALLLRLTATGFFQPVAEFLAKPNIAAFLIYLETGRFVRFSPSSEDLSVFAPESAEPDFSRLKLQATSPPTEPVEVTEAPKPPQEAAILYPEEAEKIKFKNSAGVRFDGEALLTKSLQWDLRSEDAAVLILHTHGSESYTAEDGEDYEESAAFRTLDEAYNMISVGDYLAELLEQEGVQVIHDRQLHDYPSYNGSYSAARKAINRYLKENPEICLVLDLHRDASGDVDNQMRTLATVEGEDAAQIMFVVGTGSSGAKNKHWQDNLALVMKMQTLMERKSPGICRSINLRGQRFNQDLMAGMLLVEVGAAGNSRAEALRAVEVLAQAVVDLAQGTQ